MTGQQIDRDRLRELASGATPGPWESVWEEADEWYSITGQSYECYVCPEVATLTDEADADFIVTARTAVPALLDMLDQAEAERDQARDHLAAQEVSDDAVCDLIEDRLYDAMFTACVQEPGGEMTTYVDAPLTEVLRIVCDALTAARAARRDEDPSGPLRPLTTDERSYRCAQDLGYELPEDPR